MPFDIIETYKKNGQKIPIKMTFADSWQAIKYDDSTYHKNIIAQDVHNRKAVDVVAVSPKNVMILIEVKEKIPDTKDSNREFIQKCYDTIAGMVCAWMAGEDEVVKICKPVFNTEKPKIQVVLLVINPIPPPNTPKDRHKQKSITDIQQQTLNILSALGLISRLRYLSSPSSEFGWEAHRI